MATTNDSQARNNPVEIRDNEATSALPARPFKLRPSPVPRLPRREVYVARHAVDDLKLARKEQCTVDDVKARLLLERLDQRDAS